MRNLFLLSLILLLLNPLNAQQVSLRGKAVDSENNNPLYFANIRVLGTSYGTTTNRAGEFELKLKPGKIKLAASFLGYFSDTVEINTVKPVSNIIFFLRPTNIFYPEITIKPGENPAVPIIRKAILRKEERNRLINNFEFEAYTKGIIKTTEEIKAGSNSIGIGTSNADASELKITGLLENQSKSYFQKPGKYKEVILARKQSANMPASINTLTGGRLIQNFYDDRISFFNRELPGPLASDALSYYYFYIEAKTSLNKNTVYKIHVAPDNSTDPGFTGSIYIADSTYDLVRVELMLNRAANTGGLLDSIAIKQHFAEYENGVYMPSNYSLTVQANPLGLLRFGFEIISILYDYKINNSINQDIFDKAVITVLPDADKKDSLYWTGQQVIPNTYEEHTAYKRIDSVESVPLTFWDRFSLLSDKIYFTDNFAVSAPLSMYHFNRVEGNSLDLGFYLSDAFDNRFSSSILLSNGFADKKFKTDFSSSYLLGNYRTTKLSFSAYNKLSTLFKASEDYNDLTATLLALISKNEFRDYFYSKGFEAGVSSEVFPVLKLSAGIFNRTDQSAVKNTEFSLFAKSRTYRENPAVMDFSNLWGYKIGAEIDFRNYIEDGYYRRRINDDGKFFIIGAELSYLKNPGSWFSKSLIKNEIKVSIGLRTFRAASLSVRMEFILTDSHLPYQMLYALPANIKLASKRYTFRNLMVNEVISENTAVLFLEHNFRDELFKMFRVPGLKDSELQLYGFYNAAFTSIDNSFYFPPAGPSIPGEASRYIQQFDKKPYMEAGFGIGHILFPMQIEFSWKLNYRTGNNFRIGLNSIIF